jgi:GNAT superfamily N-acetyltransferase
MTAPGIDQQKAETLVERAVDTPSGGAQTRANERRAGTVAPGDGPRIRRASADDIPELERLVERSVLGLQARDYDGRVLNSALHSGLLMPDPRLISDGTYYVAEMGGRIVGAGGWSRRRNIINGAPEADDLLDPATEAAKIRAFYVHPERARTGIGSRLLRACEEAARRAGFRRLELISTLTGVPLYAARGWQAHEPLRIPLPDGQTYPAIRMTKTVEASPGRINAA